MKPFVPPNHHPECPCEFCEIVRLRARVAELEGIPDWLSRFYEDNGYVPYPSVIKSQFNIK